MKTLIGLVEDKAINRNTFQEKIKFNLDLEMLFIAVNGNDCLSQLKGLPYNKQPSIIFMDLEMPELDGIQTIQIAKALYPHIHFIVLTVFDDDEKIFDAIRSGAEGYLLKDETGEQITMAITNILTFGGAPMSPAIARKALKILSNSNYNPSVSQKNNEVSTLLSEREKEILHYTIKGFDAKRIAEITSISVLTVRKHISNIYQKLHVNSKAQVMNMAHQRNWFKSEPE